MKNIFKKSSKKENKVTVQKLEKTQLEKVIGGLDSSIIEINEEAERTGTKGTKISFGGGTTSVG